MFKNQIFIRVLSVIMIGVLAPFYALTYGIDALSAGTRCEAKSTNIVGIGAYFRSQGMTADEEGNLYFSSKTTLYKTLADGRTFVNANLSAIPEELKENCNIKHIGGLSYYDGKIYAGMEDSKKWQHPIVGVYDAQTLQMITYYELDAAVHTRGLPWVTVDKEAGLLYAFDHSKQPTAILAYDIAAGMKAAERVELDTTVPSIQGGEFLNGTLYVATNDETQGVYTVDVKTGVSQKVFDRGLTGGSEGEGMTFVTKDGEVYLLAMDMGSLFINANLRWYKIDT